MAPSLPAPAAHALIQAITVLRVVTYLSVSSLCLLVYDCVITMDQEVKFVWGQRWSFGKATYIFIRYATILTLAGHVACMYAYLCCSGIPLKFIQQCTYSALRYWCHAVEAIFVWSEVAILIAGSSILIVRTWLLWGGGRWILAALIGGLLLSSILAIYYIIDMKFTFLNINSQLLRGCVVRIPSTAWRPIVFPLLYETFIIVLTVAKVSMTPDHAPLMMRLFVDGTLYYIAAAAVLLLTTLGAAYTPTRAIAIGSGFHAACISIGCSRLSLSLHSWAYENQHRSVTHFAQSGANKRTPDHSPSSPLPISYPQGFAPVRPDKLVPRADIEAGKATITNSPNASVTALLIPQPAVAGVRSMLPDIGHPLLPEQMLFTSSLMHTPQHRRLHRPPRSSSLYPARPTFQGSGSTGQFVSIPEFEGAKRGTNKVLVERQRLMALDTQKKYNVI